MPLVFVYLVIFSYAILKDRLLDIELLAWEAVSRLPANLLVIFPIPLGYEFARSAAMMNGPLLFRTTGTLAASVLSFSLGIMFLRKYEEPVTRRLALFFLILGAWLAWELPLDMPPFFWSVPLDRVGYALGCFTLISWWDFWRGYFAVRTAPHLASSPSRGEGGPPQASLAKGGGEGEARWYLALRWSAWGMAALSIFTPWVLRSLQFDPTHRNAALEVPGKLYGVFAAWFLAAAAWSAGWVLAAFCRAYRDLTRPAFGLILGALVSGLTGAAAYFLYVERLLSFPVHPFLAMACCACLAGSLLARGSRSLWQERHADFYLGATSLACPFAIGALLNSGILFKLGAVGIAFKWLPKIYAEVEKSVAQWLAELFKGRRSFRHSLHLTRQQSYRLSNMPDLVEETKRKVSESLGVERATLYFHDVTSNQFIAIGPEAEKQPVYGENHPLVKRLAQGPVFRDYACGLPDGALAASPLYQESGLFGFFLIGPVRHPGASVTVRMLESARLDIEHPMMIAHIYYENAVTLDKFCHDNIRYAGNIRLFLKSFLLGRGANFPTALDQRLTQLLQQPSLTTGQPPSASLATGGPPEDVREDLRQTQGELADFKEGLTSVTRRADSEASLLERNLRDLREKMTTLAKRMQGKYGMGRYDMRELVLEALVAMRGRAQEAGIELASSFSLTRQTVCDSY